MLPLHHTSAVEVLEPLSGVAGLPLDGEIPLFAATRAFAYAEGGPITRAFIEALPDDWADAVVDSSLVWLTPGLAHDDEHLREQVARVPRVGKVDTDLAASCRVESVGEGPELQPLALSQVSGRCVPHSARPL